MLHVTPEPLLSERTTLHLGGRAVAEIRVETEEDCHELPQTLRAWGGEPFVIGAGSNLLARDGQLPVTLVRGAVMQGAEIVGEEGDKVLVRVGGGVGMPRFLARCAKMGLSGLEGLSGIPGSVGGAVAMNAGSFGASVGPLLHSIRIYSSELGIMDVPASQLEYSYRHMGIQNLSKYFLLLYTTFGLTRDERSGINERMRRNFFKKNSTQPIHAWSAGCAFKNPSAEQPAGMLLEQAGFKGKTLGGMAFSTLHANFLVNESSGTATAALELMALAQDAVEAHFGVRLTPEVRILPCQPS